MMSTCTRSALRMRPSSRSRFAKSAARMLGLMRVDMRSSLPSAAGWRRHRPARSAPATSAMNIASVPCRCGHSCTVRPSPARSSGCRDSPCTTAAVSSCSACPPQRSSARRGAVRLGRVRRARDVGEHSPGASARNAASASSPCSAVSSATSAGALRQRASGRRRSAPSPCRARRAGSGRSRRARRARPGRARGRRDLVTGTSSGTAAIARRTSSARAGATSLATSVAPPASASAASSAVLPPGPAQRSSHRSPARTGAPRLSASAASCEPSSCTRTRPPLRARRSQRLAGGGQADRRVPVGLAERVGVVDEARQHHEVHARRRVVGLEQRDELVAAVLALERGAERGRSTAGASAPRRARGRAAGLLGDELAPSVGLAARHRAQHRR